jgi:hypothetical protein
MIPSGQRCEVDLTLDDDLLKLYSEPTGLFNKLVAASGLAPDFDWRGRDLRDMDFTGADLREFDFSGCDLRGTNLRAAAKIDDTTKLSGAKLDDEDQAWCDTPTTTVGPTSISIEALDEMKQFLNERVFSPSLLDTTLPTRARNAVRTARSRVSEFRRAGDLIEYMDRFRPSLQELMFFSKGDGHRLENIHAEFMKRYRNLKNDRTTIADFEEGKKYNAADLSIYAGSYDKRGGGIRPVGEFGVHEAVVVNVTLSGRYDNKWIENGTRLKCYLKSKRVGSIPRYSEKYVANRAIIEFPGLPILVFVREKDADDFTYYGVFRSNGVYLDDDRESGIFQSTPFHSNGSSKAGKWFDLVKVTECDSGIP